MHQKRSKHCFDAGNGFNLPERKRKKLIHWKEAHSLVVRNQGSTCMLHNMAAVASMHLRSQGLLAVSCSSACPSLPLSLTDMPFLTIGRTLPRLRVGWISASAYFMYVSVFYLHDGAAGWQLQKFYASLLSAASITSSKTLGNKAWSHTSFLLLGASGVYIYRDIYPLVTFTLSPMDKEEGRILWAKIAILFFVGAFISFWIPHQYIPVDPKVNALL